MKPEEKSAIDKMNLADMEKCQRAYDLVIRWFNDDIKAICWFESPNEHFNNTPPKKLMINGKIDVLLKFIEDKTKSIQH